jgi:steroid delta-isomerase-like uncharacterized protein
MKNNKLLVESYYENLWNKKDKTYIDKVLSDDIIFRSSLGTQTHGKKEFEEYFDMITQALSTLYHSVESVLVDQDQVVVRVVYNGKHTGKLLHYEPTNKRVQYYGASFFTIENGKITQVWVLGDLVTLYKQLEN